MHVIGHQAESTIVVDQFPWKSTTFRQLFEDERLASLAVISVTNVADFILNSHRDVFVRIVGDSGTLRKHGTHAHSCPLSRVTTYCSSQIIASRTPFPSPSIKWSTCLTKPESKLYSFGTSQIRTLMWYLGRAKQALLYRG